MGFKEANTEHETNIQEKKIMQRVADCRARLLLVCPDPTSQHILNSIHKKIMYMPRSAKKGLTSDDALLEVIELAARAAVEHQKPSCLLMPINFGSVVGGNA
jgi:hypothetical protein